MNKLEVESLVKKIKVAIYLDRRDYNKRTDSVLFDLVDLMAYKETGDDPMAENCAYVSHVYEELLKAIHLGMTTKGDLYD